MLKEINICNIKHSLILSNYVFFTLCFTNGKHIYIPMPTTFPFLRGHLSTHILEEETDAPI